MTAPRPTLLALASALAALTLAVVGGGPAVAEPEAQPGAARVAGHAAAPGRLTRLAGRLAEGGDIRIVAFGSSSTEGAGASSPATTYPAALQRILAERLQIGADGRRAIGVINRGHGGDTSEAMSARLGRDVLDARPDLVIWQTGSNDPLAGVPVERFAALTREGILAIRATGADVVLMDQQWCRRLSGVEGAIRYVEALHAVAAELGVPVIRRSDLMHEWVSSGVLTQAEMIGPDGLHMTDAGYAQLARAVALQLLAGAGVRSAALARD